MKKIIVLLGMILLMATFVSAAPEWCYQESANETSPCGGVAGAHWTQSGNWVFGAVRLFDGNWFNEDGRTSGAAYAWVNYTKPDGATNNSLWETKPITGGSTRVNNTIPSACWDALPNQLNLRITSVDGGGEWHCWNGASFIQIYKQSAAQRNMNEEAMWWEIDLCVPDWSCDGYEACNTSDLRPCNSVTDLNTCGDNYTGNYSEFSPLTCDYCTPSWSCSDFDDCNVTDVEPCLNVTDSNGCYGITGLPADDFNGTVSTYDGACVYCDYHYCETYTAENMPGVIVETTKYGLDSVLAYMGLYVFAALVVIFGAGLTGLIKVLKK